MTATRAPLWRPALTTIEQRVRLIGAGFGVEIALVWPVRTERGRLCGDTQTRRRGHLLGVPLLASLVVEPGATHDLVSERTWTSR